MKLASLPLEQRTTVGALRRAVATAPDRAFLRHGATSITYAEFDAAANGVASGLRALGVGRNDKVALFLRNSFEFVTSWLGIAKLGAIYVPINTDYKGDILEYQLNRAEVTHVVVDADLAPRLAAVHARLSKLAAVVVVRRSAPAESPTFDRRIALVDYEEVAAGRRTDPDVRIDYREPHAISFTSGTTGPSKGVLATHCHTVTFALDWIEACGVRPDDRLYTCLPMFHAIATWLGVLPAMLCGTTIAFAERFSASRFWDDVRAYDATVVHGIFSMVPMLLKQPPRDDDATVPARIFYIGQRNEEFERRFDCRIVEVYGATETGIVTYTPPHESGAAGSCGRANSRTYDVEIVDDEDRPVPTGEVGEIVVRPRQPYSVLSEYYGMPAETLTAFRNLWFHTGDNGRRDSDGWIYFADRKKDAIRRRGENISSFEVERALVSDPRISECAAIAVPSELGEDEVKVVIVRRPDATLSAEDVWALCEERMPKFWVPRFVEFRAELPKTPNGKVQKYHLRAGRDAGEQYDRQQNVQQRERVNG